MHDVVLVPVPEAVLPAYLPVFACLVPAGFPSPADDHIEALFDLNQLLFRHPDATYLVRVTGESMAGAEIHPGDLLAVDKHLPADHGHIVVAVVEGDCTVKRFERIRTGEEIHIWGVVTHVVHELIPGKLNALLLSRD
jgi:DNA polymerase V